MGIVEIHMHNRCLRMFGCVRQLLLDDLVRRDLEALRQPLAAP